MVFKRRRIAWGVAAAAVIALSITGCAGGGGSSSGAPKVIVSPIVANPPSLSPLANESTAYMLRGEFYDTLVRVKTDDLSVVPGLVESWDVSTDGLTYTFHLHQGVMWHDGKPFTSADVKFNLTEAIKQYSPLATTAALITGVDTPDDNTAVVHLSAPAGYFLAGLSNLYISPAHIFQGTDLVNNPAWNTPVGTGPFKFESFDQGTQVTGVKNDNYWDGPVNADRIVNPIIPDSNARTLALTSGQANLLFRDGVDPTQLPTFEADPKYQVVPIAGAPEEQIMMINQRPGRPLSDIRVRQALMHAINRDPIIQRAYFGAANPAPSNIPRAIGWATNQNVDYAKQYPFDLNAAASLLDQAGYPAGPDGTRFTFTIAYDSLQQQVAQSGQLLSSDLSKIGVKVNLVSTDFQSQIARVWGGDHDFDIFLVQTSTEADPSILLATVYQCNPTDIAYGNASGVCDQNVDSLFAQAAVSPDQAQRGQLFQQADAAIADQLYATIPTVVTASPVVAAANVTGIDAFHSTTEWNWAALGVSQ
ncbi:ABC transporter substrate-binding protein [Microbacterium sp. X-17]|uniref:ABC transporter substrate-binding protein n=1 Tax=Microbacterium sp. X-17 TaxID=3144404 RepID=UPI0031F4AD30